MTSTPQPGGFAALRDELFLDIGRRHAAKFEEIASAERDIARLTVLAREHADRQQTGAAQQAMREAMAKKEEVRVARLAIRALDEEREEATRGVHPRLANAGHGERTAILSAQQLEYREATAAFNAQITAGLTTQANRLVQASTAMGYEPPALALAIAQRA